MTKNVTVLYAWECGEGSGHVVRALPLLKHLVAKGFKVIVALRDVSRSHLLMDAVDGKIEIMQAPAKFSRTQDPIRGAIRYSDTLHNSGYSNIEEPKILVALWKEILIRTQTDILIADFAPTATLTAFGMGIPYIGIGTGYLCPPATAPLPLLRGCRPSPSQSEESLAREKSVCELMNAALRHSSLHSIESVGQLLVSNISPMLLTLPELDHYSGRMDAKYFGYWHSHGMESPQWSGGEGKKVYCYLKPFRALGSLLRLLDHWGMKVLLVPDGIPTAELQRLNLRGLTLSRKPVSMSSVAAQCDFAITNGNHGSTISLLLCGVPLFCCPLHTEQKVTAMNIAKQNLGSFIEAWAPQDNLEAALSEVAFNPVSKERALAFAARYQSASADWEQSFLDDAYQRIHLATT